MASVTQTIPTYTGGISQQPDELKKPGQVNTAKNVIPDVTEGLTKRPGGKLLASMSDSSAFTLPDGSYATTTYDPDSQTNGKWFSYYRDETEQYIGQIDRTGNVRVWKCSTGEPVPVMYEGGAGSSTETALKLYLNHYGDEDLQTLTLNDYTYICNRGDYKSDGTTAHPKTTVAMKTLTAGEYNSDTSVTADKNKNDVRDPEVYIDLKKIAYSSQYAVDLYDSTTSSTISTATRIKVERDVDSSNGCTGSNTLPSSGNLPDDGNRCTNAAGADQDSYCPNVDTRIFSISAGDSGDAEDANGTAHTYPVVRSGTSYSSGEMANLYFRIATIGQSVAQGDSQANPDYHCRYTTTHDLLYGGEGWETGDYFDVWMKNARYRITIMDHSVSKIQATMNSQAGSGAIRPLPTPFDNETTITAESILGDMRTIIEGYNNGITSSETQQIGTGLYLTNGTSFNVSTPNGDLLNVFAQNVNTIEDLPQQCKHGYVVKVKNSDADEDDYFVKFIGENGRDGSGVWEECPEPGRKINFDEETMPVQMVRHIDDSSGTRTGTANAIYFRVGYPTWDKCQTGDTITNPEPTFVGKKISQIVFFRNRFCMLAGTNVVMSRPGDYWNFWNKSAITYSNTDPIDLSISSKFPSTIYDAIGVSSGLVLFTKNEQFMLTTDSDILNPTTAKINSIADYNFNYKTNPVSLGTSIGFLDNAGKYTRFFEMAGIRREGEPKVVEQSKVVSKLFDAELDNISASRENAVIFFNEKNKSTIYGFRYFNAAEKRQQQAWFTWELSGNVQYHCMLDDSFYAVIRNGSKDVMQKFDLKMLSDSRSVTDDMNTADTEDDIVYRVHLDNSYIQASSGVSYSATTNKTTFSLPTGFNNSSGQLAVYVVPSASDDTFQGMTANATLNSTTVELAGNWKTYVDDDGATQTPANNFILGYQFDMEVEFPTIHIQRQQSESYRADTRGSLVVHRIKLSLGDSGQYSTILKRLGKDTYTETHEPVDADAYNANQIALTSESIRTIPVYDRNINCDITLKSTHPSPATLQSMTWEGDYNPKFYRRV